MKNYIILFLALFLASPAFSEKKDKTDPKDLKIDSLTKANKVLTLKVDSLVKLSDSLTVRLDSAYKSNTITTTSLNDTLSTLKKENVENTATLNSMTEKESANNRLVYELKQLKELLDSKILTQSEFDIRKAKILQKWE